MIRNELLRKWSQLVNEDSISWFVEWKKQQKKRTNKKKGFGFNLHSINHGYSMDIVEQNQFHDSFFFGKARWKKKFTNWDQLKFIYHLVNIQHGIEQFPCQKKLTMTKDLHNSHWIQSQRVSCVLFITSGCSRMKSEKKKTKKVHTRTSNICVNQRIKTKNVFDKSTVERFNWLMQWHKQFINLEIEFIRNCDNHNFSSTCSPFKWFPLKYHERF